MADNSGQNTHTLSKYLILIASRLINSVWKLYSVTKGKLLWPIDSRREMRSAEPMVMTYECTACFKMEQRVRKWPKGHSRAHQERMWPQHDCKNWFWKTEESHGRLSIPQ